MGFELPTREGELPKVGQVPPQLQYSDLGPEHIRVALHEWCFSIFPDVIEHDTLISVPTTRALWLDEKTPAAHDDAFMPPPGSREFCHLHLDGSLHAVMGENEENEVLEKRWGLRHMYYDSGVKEILVFAPRCETELDIVKQIVTRSYEYAVGIRLEKS